MKEIKRMMRFLLGYVNLCIRLCIGYLFLFCFGLVLLLLKKNVILDFGDGDEKVFGIFLLGI